MTYQKLPAQKDMDKTLRHRDEPHIDDRSLDHRAVFMQDEETPNTASTSQNFLTSVSIDTLLWSVKSAVNNII